MDIEIDFKGERDERAGTPEELILAADFAATEVLPTKSRKRYDQVYADFQKWKTSKGTTSISQRVLMAYFGEVAEKMKPTTLWARYSMLKATMKIYDDVDIATYSQLTAYLKTKAAGYKPAKAAVFSEEEIQKFINEAPDEAWLDVKVACIFGVSGACRTHELPDIKIEDIKKHDDLLLVTIPVTKTKIVRKFTVTGPFFNVVQKYAALRPSNGKDNRFFLNFQRGKCTVQPIGKNKFYGMPRRIATYLNLSEPERYTGHSFRRTSATILANTGASIEMVKRHGAWNSSKVAESYIEDSVHYKKQTGDLITSSINCTRTSMSSLSDESNLADFNNPLENSNDVFRIAGDSGKQNERESDTNAELPSTSTTLTQNTLTQNTLTQNHKEKIDKSFKFYNCNNITIVFGK